MTLQSEEERPADPSAAAVSWRQGSTDASPFGAAELAIRALLEPHALRITAEPVFRLGDRSLLAYELRWRLPRLDALPAPDDFWSTADTAGLLEPLDDQLLQEQLEVAKRASPAVCLISLDGWRRTRPGLARLLAARVREAGLPLGSVVWQLGDDDHSPSAVPAVDLATDLRIHGFKVALKDLGDGKTRLSVVARVLPEVLQLDRSLVEGITSEAGLQATVSGLVEFARRTGSKLVGGGLRTMAELEALTAIGVPYGMGPLFGPPLSGSGPDGIPSLATKEILDLDQVEPSAISTGPAVVMVGPDLGPLRRGITVTEALGHAARALQAEHDPKSILEIAADHLQRLTPFDGIAVYQADWDSLNFRPLLARSATEPSYATGVMNHSFPLGTGITGWAFDLGTPQLVGDADSHPAAGHLPGTTSEDESILAIPLVAGDHRLGMINLVRFRRDGFTPEDLSMASLVGHMAAAAWRNAQLYLEQRQHAITDPLTGLFNVRWLRDSGGRELARTEREGQQLILMMVDLDNFKRVNDSCGHTAGDIVLRAVGRALQQLLREEDAAVRYGGEEFVVLLREPGEEGVRRVTSELRRGLAEIPLPPGSDLSKISASVGIARFPEHGRTLSQLLGSADTAMYAAKRAGGDRSAWA